MQIDSCRRADHLGPAADAILDHVGLETSPLVTTKDHLKLLNSEPAITRTWIHTGYQIWRAYGSMIAQDSCRRQGPLPQLFR